MCRIVYTSMARKPKKCQNLMKFNWRSVQNNDSLSFPLKQFLRIFIYCRTILEDNNYIEPAWGNYEKMATPNFLRKCSCTKKEREKPCWNEIMIWYDCFYRCNRVGLDHSCSEKCGPKYRRLLDCEEKFADMYKDKRESLNDMNYL